MADQTKPTGQESQITPVKGHTLQRYPKESQAPHASKPQQQKRFSPLLGIE